MCHTGWLGTPKAPWRPTPDQETSEVTEQHFHLCHLPPSRGPSKANNSPSESARDLASTEPGKADRVTVTYLVSCLGKERVWRVEKYQTVSRCRGERSSNPEMLVEGTLLKALSQGQQKVNMGIR